MSVRRWAYEPEKCDGDFCHGSCYRCPKADDGEHLPIEIAMAMLGMMHEKGDNQANEDI